MTDNTAPVRSGLTSLARRMVLPPIAFLTDLLRLTESLEIIHRNGYLCLNLSPETVLCRENGSVFPRDPESLIPKEDFLQGIRHSFSRSVYCAPEVMRYTGEYLERKRFVKMGERADVFSVGMILYLYLMGTVTGSTVTDSLLQTVYASILAGEFSVQREDIPPAIRQQLSALLQDTLAYFAGDRLGDMGLFSRRLRAILLQFPEYREIPV